MIHNTESEGYPFCNCKTSGVKKLYLIFPWQTILTVMILEICFFFLYIFNENDVSNHQV